ncbi:antiviral reverse transcriptase Drt2 [Methyloversatilis discipulorum]|uniref:antiviral reverse transcriptase Drt2 n=1 Tax=Methyloversatilis discipulorum TaxID=1119528 RepID=UPI0009DB83F8|nr:antiviral reverse transcriptase Drt2 [Methyloversatilis discipulorum]
MIKKEAPPPWYRLRRYLHFDNPLGLKKAELLVTDTTAVARHSFWPLIQFEIESAKIRKNKATGKISTKIKKRPISYAAHSDSQIFSYYCQLLSEAYESEILTRELSNSVLAFRSLGKSNIDFAKQAFDTIKTMGDCTALAFDITKFFDTLSHRILKQQWKELLKAPQLPPDHYAVFKAVTRFSFVDRNSAFAALKISVHNPRTGGKRRLCSPSQYRDLIRGANLIKTNPKGVGIPQGTAISALLSNIYMLEFDSMASDFVQRNGGTYMRYCDDILFLIPLEKKKITEDFLSEELKKLEISINPDKTEARNFTVTDGLQNADRPLQYLGFLFDGQRITIRPAAFAKFSNRMKKGVSLAKLTKNKRDKLRLTNGAQERPLYCKKLFTRYSHLGKRNFLRYGYSAAHLMNSKAIRRQLRPLWTRLQREINKENK